jgi:hypothetical protein
MKGLNDLVDGGHYFDTIADDATFEFLYEFPGWPRTILRAPKLHRYVEVAKARRAQPCSRVSG